MAYALTQDDIDRLGIPNAKAGDIANPADRALLGLEPDAEALSLQTPVSATAAAPQVASAAAPMVNSQQDLAGLLNPVPKDPFESLSRGQRTMMGFAALKDAGFALQGKEGTAVRSVMKDITSRADMERKRTAALAQNQLIQRALGGTGPTSGAGQPQTAEEYRQAATALARQIATMGPAGQSMIPMLQQMQAEAERLAAIEKGEQNTVKSTAAGIETVSDLIATVRDNPNVTGLLGTLFSLVPTSKAAEARIDVDTLRSNMALDALKNLKATGATLGSVSEAELALLESEIAQINLNQSQDAVIKDLTKIQNRYQNAIRAAYRDTNQPEALDRVMVGLFGEVPTWATSGEVIASTGTVGTGDLTPEELAAIERN